VELIINRERPTQTSLTSLDLSCRSIHFGAEPANACI
jgi:hypothetical protein